MPDDGGQGLHIHPVLQGHGSKGVPVRYIYDNTRKFSNCNGFTVFHYYIQPYWGGKNRGKTGPENSDVPLTTTIESWRASRINGLPNLKGRFFERPFSFSGKKKEEST